jgi:hypothetical protein
MPVPKTIQECEARAHAAAKAAMEDPENVEFYNDVYNSEFDELRVFVPNQFGDTGIDYSAVRLVASCRRLRYETDAPSAVGLVVAAIIKAADQHFKDTTPDRVLQEIVTSLVDLFGADKVRAAIGGQS